MHTGFISFCDRICNNIKSLETKEIILNEMEGRFGVQILQKHWHRLDEKGIQHIVRVPHLACLRSNGNPYYMFFTRYEDVPIMFYVDKKVQPGYQKPRMIIGRGQWDEQLSEGTLFDGEMVKDNTNKWIFLVNDLLAFKGRHLTHEHLPERLRLINVILETMYKPEATMDVCSYQVKRYAHATQSGTDSLVAWSKDLPYTNRGIYYWPFSSKFKPKLHNFDESLIRAVSMKVKDTPEFRMEPPVAPAPAPSALINNLIPTIPLIPDRTHTAPTLNPIPKEHVEQEHITTTVATTEKERTLWLRKTEFPDVFDLFPSDAKSESRTLHGTRLGIAYIKTLDDSRMMREAFKRATVAVYIPFRCIQENNKWKPISRVI